jgi:hypothetical protein
VLPAQGPAVAKPVGHIGLKVVCALRKILGKQTSNLPVSPQEHARSV